MKKLFSFIAIIVTVLTLVDGCGKKDDGRVRVIIVGTDGLRWQEVFSGVDPVLIGGYPMGKPYVKDTREERREALMPFTWNFVAKNGILIGDRESGSTFDVTNNMWFSYPGWSEIICGHADDEFANSNNPGPNRNVSVMESANNDDRYRGKVLAFGGWDAFTHIINEERAGFPVNCGAFYSFPEGYVPTDNEAYIHRLQDGVPEYLGSVRSDAITHEYALEAMRSRHPEVLFIGYAETDDWAHRNRYDLTIFSCHNFDRYLKELWDCAQSDPFYKDRTIFIVTTDHGRGSAREQWTDHGKPGTPGSGETWCMIYGKGIPAKGVLTSGNYFTNQIAPTAAKWLGIELPAHEGQGEPLDIENL